MAFRRYSGALRLDEAGPRSNGAGGSIYPARLTRIGVFPYRAEDGSVVREARLPEEVFSAESLASLTAAPLTIEHPPTFVTPESYSLLSVGGLLGSPCVDGIYVTGDVLVASSTALEAVKGGKSELSCGYSADLDPTPGEYQGQPYDAIQRNIRYNHIALTDRGRAGPEVRLLMDSDRIEVQRTDSEDAPPPAAPEAPAAPAPPASAPSLEERVAALEAAVASLVAPPMDAVPPAAPAAPAAPAEAPNKEDSIRQDERLRVKAGAKAGQGTREAVLAALRIDTDTGSSMDYLEGLLDAASASAGGNPFRMNRADGGSEDLSTAEAARLRMIAKRGSK